MTFDDKKSPQQRELLRRFSLSTGSSVPYQLFKLITILPRDTTTFNSLS